LCALAFCAQWKVLSAASAARARGLMVEDVERERDEGYRKKRKVYGKVHCKSL
jgi:hypothetical protein